MLPLGPAMLAAGLLLGAADSPPPAPTPTPPEAAPEARPAEPAPVGGVPEETEAESGNPEEPAEGPEQATVQPETGVKQVSLEQAIAFALEGNFSMATTVDALAAARLQESAVRADFYPKVTPRFQRSSDELLAGADMTQSVPWTGGSVRAGFSTRDPADPEAARVSDLQVLYVQPLLRGFGPNASLYALRNARRQRQGQERGLVQARQSLIVQVTQAFFQVVRQRKLLEVARQSQRRSESLGKASESRMRVGLVSKLDVFRAEIQAAQALESAVAAETGLETALESFRVLLGLAPREPLEPEDVRLDEDLSVDLEPVEVLVERAREQRLDLAESRDRVDDARRDLALARQNLLPTLDLNVEFTQTGTGQTLGESLKPIDHRVSLTLSAGYAVERAADRARRAIAELNLRASERGLRERELGVEAEVRAAARQIERLQKSVELQRQGLTFAEQQQRLATLRYQRGLASNFDVVDAEGNLVSARTALVGLLTDLVVARIQLLRATGTLDVLDVQAINPAQGAGQ